MKKLDNKGNVSVIFSLIIIALFGVTAIVVDIGIAYSEKTKLSNAIDAAALAATLELPVDEIKARAVAIEYLQKNNVDPNRATISISADKKSIQIEAVKNVNHLFAQIIGISNSELDVHTKAIVAPANSVSTGLRPFAIEAYNFSYGQLVTLKKGAGNGYNGNYGVMAIGGRGSVIFKNNTLYGYNGVVSVGDYLDSEPGNMAGTCNAIQNYIKTENSTFNNFPRNSIRLWTVPLVQSLDIDGRKPVKVVGFAAFYVEDAQNSGGNMEIVGRFVKYVLNASVNENLSDTGAYGSKLSK